jgi:hypothetical protein
MSIHLCATYLNRISLWYMRHDLERAVADCLQAIDGARHLGAARLERNACANLAEILYLDGKLEDALPWARRAERIETLTLGHAPDIQLLVLRIQAALGDCDQLDERLEALGRLTQHPILTALKLYRRPDHSGWERVLDELAEPDRLEVLAFAGASATRTADHELLLRVRALLAQHHLQGGLLERLLVEQHAKAE